MAAYALSRIRLPGGRAIFLLILFGTMLPFQVMLAPLFTLVNQLGLINTYVRIILPYLAFGIPYQVFILHGFFSEVPKELSEAARVDGASHLTIFRRIFLPISLPVLAALLILDFVATWNEFATMTCWACGYCAVTIAPSAAVVSMSSSPFITSVGACVNASPSGIGAPGV